MMLNDIGEWNDGLWTSGEWWLIATSDDGV